MREVGISAIDAHFKGLVPRLEKAAQLRENFLSSQEKFKEILGLSLATSLKKSLEALAIELGKVSFPLQQQSLGNVLRPQLFSFKKIGPNE